VDETFKEVVEAEIKQLASRREQRKLDPINTAEITGATTEEVLKKVSKQQLIGLAFSGGGIRSATFNLGFLQGLAGLGILKIFDYLSTVSGGGYIGGWLAAWMQRQGAKHVEKELDPEQAKKKAENELDPIRHLRRYSNYLAPNQSILSADRWVLWAIYLRNFLLNHLVLLPAAAGLVLAARILTLSYYPIIPAVAEGYLYDGDGNRLQLDLWYFWRFLAAFTVLTLVGLANAYLAASVVKTKESPADTGKMPWNPAWLRWAVVLPLVLAAAVFCLIVPYAFPFSAWLHEVGYLNPDDLPSWAPAWLVAKWFVDLLAFIAFGALVISFSYASACCLQLQCLPSVFFYSMLAGAAWGAMLYAVYEILYAFFNWDLGVSLMYVQIGGTAFATTFGPPMVLLSVVVGAAFGVGMLRNWLTEELREWWASLSARLLMIATVWLSVNLIALYGTPLVLWAGFWAQTALASGWAISILTGVMAGGSSRTDGTQAQGAYLDVLARLASYIFVAGIFILVSLLVHFLIDNPPNYDPSDEAAWPYRYEPVNPATRVRVERTGENGKVSIDRRMEYSRVPNQAAAAQQQYWLGMVNTGDNQAQVSVYFDANDLRAIEKMLVDAGISTERLAAFRKRRQWNIADFEKEVNIYFGKDAKEARKVVDLVRQAKKDHLDRFEVDPTLFKDGKVSDAIQRKLAPIPFQIWRYEQLQDKIDELFPEAWNHTIRRKILQRASGAGAVVAFDKAWRYVKLICWLIACGFALWVALRRVDVNAFSLQGLYANRLIRAYLGASRYPRDADPYTQFDYQDDVPMRKLRADAAGLTKDAQKRGEQLRTYDGPYPLVNVALNLVHGDKLDWQERKAAAFVLTPHHCGSDVTGYCPTVLDGKTKAGLDEEKTYAGDLTLGTAVAISGAAASPNSGYHSSPAVTFLLTVFNARLGSWLGNPSNPDTREQPSPWYGMMHLFKEMIGWTDATSKYVYLSDGGHFENLAVYELIKRRCQFVVVCDAGQDESHAFEDLGNMIRKVRIDHKIRIEISPDFLRLQKEPRKSRWHCAVGKIRYDDVDKEQAPGLLIYVKPSLTGDEPADVLHYATGHPAFPHETTADQFYTESQFESYRALGQHIAEAVFESACDEAIEKKGKPDDLSPGNSREWCQELFAALERRWFAMPPEFEARFVESTHGYIDVQKALREDPRLAQLTLDLYPELNSAITDAVNAGQQTIEVQATIIDAVNTQLEHVEMHATIEDEDNVGHENVQTNEEGRRAAEVNILLQMLQVMENAYLSLDLEATYAHPMNRGWLDVFYRWTSAGTFRRHWPHLRAEFGRQFVSFCERQMQLGVMEGVPFDANAQNPHDFDRLKQEFRMQWPEEIETLQKFETVAAAPVAKEGPFAWAVYPRRRDPKKDPADPKLVVVPGELPVGMILIMNSAKSEYDLTVWLRGAYRNTGLGRTAVQSILDKITTDTIEIPMPFTLRVRLPIKNLTGPGGKLLRGMWLTFFNHLGFARVESPDGALGQEMLIMEREFP
jgi:predicted acylesterase/phospholipase RssA